MGYKQLTKRCMRDKEYRCMKYMQKVECINERASDVIVESLIKVGQTYNLDIMSVYGDSDGDWYGQIYDDDGNFVMAGKLSHFKSL